MDRRERLIARARQGYRLGHVQALDSILSDGLTDVFHDVHMGVTAENIAAGHFDLNRVLHEWNVSTGHHANIVIPQMRHMGIGEAVGADGKTRFWAAVYAAPR